MKCHERYYSSVAALVDSGAFLLIKVNMTCQGAHSRAHFRLVVSP